MSLDANELAIAGLAHGLLQRTKQGGVGFRIPERLARCIKRRDAALFRALEQTVRQTANRQLIRVKKHINDPEFAATIVSAFRPLLGRAGGRRRVVR